MILCFFFFVLTGYHRDLHLLTHSFPTRRSADLVVAGGAEGRFDDVRLAGDIGVRGSLRGSGEVGHQEDGQQESGDHGWDPGRGFTTAGIASRSEEHKSELQSLMRT